MNKNYIYIFIILFNFRKFINLMIYNKKSSILFC
jgi:hypothetical protein